jgi:formylglycine-generating enzyme required for sulfatase activity
LTVPSKYLVVLAIVVVGLGCATGPAAGQLRPGFSPLVGPPELIRDSVPGALFAFELSKVSGGRVTVPGREGPEVVEVAPFWIGRTEVTWELYDLFVLDLDVARDRGGRDAIGRPSRPYGAPDYGFGHQGYPVISVTREAAEAFAVWLSERTGHRYRLPTEAEWVRAAEVASRADVARPDIAELAWHAGSSEKRSHPVGTRPADALGLFDLFGNAAEWVTSADGRRVTRGGSWRHPLAEVGPVARSVQDDSWNERDPQFPKSRWWLSDGPFVGFRLAREP